MSLSPSRSRGRHARPASRTGIRARIGALLGLLLALPMIVPSFAGAAPIDPDDPLPPFLSIRKDVQGEQTEFRPGDTFTFEIVLGCDQEACVDAAMIDDLPSELAGFEISDVQISPAESTIPRDVTWTEAGATLPGPPAVVGENTRLRIDTTADIGPGLIGMGEGQNLTTMITFRVPDDLEPGTSFEIPNRAEGHATNAQDVFDTASVTVEVPGYIGVEAGKTWQPPSQYAQEGAGSTIGLTATSTGNVPLETLVLQDPVNAPDGATTLDASNPFTITDLSAVAAPLPAGAEDVQVDAYVLVDGSYQWVTGTPAAAAALPAGVDPADVAGLRFTYTGEIAPGTVAEVDIDVAQRATHRDDPGLDLSLAAHTVDNQVRATGSHPDHPDVTDDATADFTMNPPVLGATAFKDIVQARIGAGQSADVLIGGSNTSAIPMSSMVISDVDFFTADITFGGFDAAPGWPAGATAGTFRYHPLDGGDPVDVPFGPTEVPAVPAGVLISGFDLVYTGEIQPDAQVNAEFTIDTTEAAAGETGNQISVDNAVSTTVTAANGRTAQAGDSDSLVVVAPGIDVDLTKSVRPGGSVAPGDRVVSSLEARAVTSSDWVTNHQIVVEDSWGAGAPADGFWNAFDIRGIPSTVVPTGAALTIEVQGPGGTWYEIHSSPAGDARTVELDTAAFAAALPAGLTPADLTGVRFTFDNAAGFPADTIVNPYVTHSARGELRDGGTVPEDATGYTNVATADAHGVTGADTPIDADDEDTATGIVDPDPSGPGPVGVDKRWNSPTVIAQSGHTRSTTIDWRVSEGYETVVLTDPIDPADPADTVFDAFDLAALRPIAASATPFTNGWFLRWDVITAIELFDGTSWVTVPAPGAGWVQGNAFVGYTLTAEQRASTTGVRITLAENTQAREATTDPYAPEPGSGVAAGRQTRSFVHDWTLRNVARTDGWVTQTRDYNDGRSAVENTVRLDADPIDGGPAATDTGADTIVITDAPPGVAVAKTVATSQSPLYAPPAGSPADAYPTATWTLQANNTSVARASYVRIVDPAFCGVGASAADCSTAGTADAATSSPFSEDFLDEQGAEWLEDSAFHRLDITSVSLSASRPGEVDLDASTAWVVRYSDGAFTQEEMTANELQALTADEFADVVAVAVTFQGADPATTGGTITSGNDLGVVIESRLRAEDRDGGSLALNAEETEPADNRTSAQSFDPVLADGDVVGDLDDAGVLISGGLLNVGVTKAITPGEIIEAQPDVPVTVTIGANQGSEPRSTLSPREVWLRDDADGSPEFWNSFDFTGLGTITPPAGADRVAVGVYVPGDDGTLAWVTGDPTTIDSAEVPVAADRYDEIQGVELTFTRADGRIFSTLLPAPGWSTTTTFGAQLRDTYRDSGEDMVFAGTVENTVYTQSIGARAVSDVVSAPAVIGLGTGTQELSVDKVANNANRSVLVGEPVPFDLYVRNSGTGYLTLEELRDTMAEQLRFTGDPAPTYEADPDGTLSEDVTMVVEGEELVFTWPDGGNVMQPGETFHIRLHLELEPGLQAGERAVNTLTARTAEELQSCSDFGSPADLTDAWLNDPTTCGTTDYVTPVAGPNMYTVKGVRGSQDGAYNRGTGAETTEPNLSASPGTGPAADGRYYRSPLVAHSVVGETDDWVLRTQNAGTVTVDHLVIYEQLPTPGDRQLIAGQRGSQYRPELTAAPVVHVPAGVTYEIEVTASSDVCVGTWAGPTNGEPCERNGETWAPADADTEWASVTGLRISVDFTARTATPNMRPGELVDVTFTTYNAPASADNPDGAFVEVPAPDQVAINSFGANYLNTGSSAWDRRAPSTVGVHLMTGSIEIEKAVTGPAAAYAPDEFLVDVECTIEGVALTMGQWATVSLTDSGEWTQRVDGIPVGAVCTVTEQGELGDYGETARTGTPSTLTVTEAVGPQEPVPAAQVATIGNDYQFGGLALTKAVETDAEAGEFGPFDFTVECTTATGVPVTFDDDGTLVHEITLEDGERVLLPENRIPVGSTCVITETGDSGADDVVFSGTGVEPGSAGSAEVVVGSTEVAEVLVTNGYDAGQIVLGKVVDGEGAELYGEGPFEFDLVCTYRGQTLVEQTVELVGGGVFTTKYLPSGTVCTVEETLTGGATSTTIDPASGSVTVPPQDGEPSSVQITATNTFDIGDLVIEKVVDGEGAEIYGAGPFEAQAVCTWERDGVTTPLALPDDGRVVLASANDYTATITDLPVGATCVVTETQTAGATSSSIDPAGGEVTIPDNAEAESVDVTITNTFDVGELRIVKAVDGPGAELYGEGPFEAQAECTWAPHGEPLPIALADDGVVRLTAENGYEATIGDLVIGAICTVTETQTGGATTTVVEPDEVTVTSSADAAEVTITNTFELGELVIEKQVDGPGAELYGEWDYEARAECSWEPNGVQTPLALADDGIVQLTAGNGYRATIGDLPVGATCTVEETLTGGAHATTLDPEDGTVVVGADEAALVTITNVFEIGDLVIEKVVDGAGAETYGYGPYKAQVECTWLRDGVVTPILLPMGGVVELTAEGDYAAVVADLPIGATCTVEETLDGGATSTSLDPVDGTVVIGGTADEEPGEPEPGEPGEPEPGEPEPGEPGQDTTVTITNTFDVGELAITKLVEGPGATFHGEGPFEAEVECTWLRNGVVTPIELADGGLVVLSAENGYQATIGDLIIGATCVVEETATGGADATSIFPADGTVVIGGADEDPGDDQEPVEPEPGDAEPTDPAEPGDAEPVVAEVTLTNVFEVTSLTVEKVVEGPAPEDATYEVDLRCTRLVDGEVRDVTVPGGATRTLEAGGTVAYDNLPLGAACVVEETETGEADTTSIAVTVGADGPVRTDGTVAELTLAADGTVAEVVVTNGFDTPPTPPTPPLPGTGFDGADVAVVAGVLLLAGGAVILLVRRRSNQ